MYKPRDTKIQDFVFRIDKMVKYLNNSPTFRAGKRLPEDEILEFLEFLLPKEWQK